MLNPKRAVLIERGDALRGRHVIWRAFFVTFATKSVMAFLAGAVVPQGNGSAALMMFVVNTVSTTRLSG
jgi:hypothetical protein